MRNVKFILLGITIMFSTTLFAQVENIANEVLKAYKERNVELLKKNASGIMKHAISVSYFEDKDIQEEIKSVDNWDGKIREIRYKSGDMFDKKVYIASIWFSEVVENKDEIYTVFLTSVDKEKWVIFGIGIGTEVKEEFNKMDKSLSGNVEEVAISKENEQKKNYTFSTEMADGTISKKITEKQISDYINKLNDDNFFLILNRDEGFMQSAYSAKGFTVQYKENGKQFEAKEYMSKENTIKIFKKYFNGDNNWKAGIEWISADY